MEWTDKGARVFACALVLSVIASTAVALRFISRGYILRVIGLTDWFLLLTLFFSLGTRFVSAFMSLGGWVSIMRGWIWRI